MYPSKEKIESSFFFDRLYGVFIPLSDSITKPRVNSDGYVVISVDGAPYLAHRCVWIVVHGSIPQGFVDHKNGIRTDNLPSNIRIASSSQNAMNRKINKRNSSGHKGVSWENREGKWKAEIRKGKKRIFRKFFDEIEEAVSAVRKARLEIHGEFARHE